MAGRIINELIELINFLNQLIKIQLHVEKSIKSAKAKITSWDQNSNRKSKKIIAFVEQNLFIEFRAPIIQRISQFNEQTCKSF